MITITKYSYFLFSGGEVHCKLPYVLDKGSTQDVILKDYTMNGLMALAEYAEIAYRYRNKIHAIIPYFPYARQDRVMVTDEPFSLRIFCKFLNSLNLAGVTIVDPHSDVVSALVHDVRVIPQDVIAKQVIPENFFTDEKVLFVSPDAGAYKKVSKLMPDDKRIVIGTKERNSKGEIVKTNIYSPVDISGKECIIVDDICDGGRTFIELTKVLKDKGASKVYLYVTHGIFSKGVDVVLDSGIDHIYTTDSFWNGKSNKVITVREIDYAN